MIPVETQGRCGWLALGGIVVGNDMCCYVERSCGETVFAVRRGQKQITVGTGAARHMARDGTWVLVATGGLDPNLDLDPVESLMKFLMQR